MRVCNGQNLRLATAAVIDGQNHPLLTIDLHQEIKQCRRHAAKSGKETHLQVV